MASGKLGSAALTAATNTTVYTTPADTVTSLTVCLVNRGSADALVRVAVGTAANPANADFIEYDATLPGNGGVLERSGIVTGAGERIVVRASTGDVTARVHGFEQGA